MNRSFAVAIILTLFAARAPVAADTINFAQFGPPGTTLPGTLTGVTTDGVSVTLTSPNGSFETFVEAPPGSWFGTFPDGAPLLFDGFGPGAVTLTFATPITSLTLAAQANLVGNFVETMQAFSGATLVDTEISGVLFNCADLTCRGTQAILTLAAAAITSVTISTTNDDFGFALYGGAGAAIPIPAALPLLASVLGLAGWFGWKRNVRVSPLQPA